MIRQGIRRAFRLDVPAAETVAADVAEEIATHIEAHRDYLVALGMSVDEAMRAAEKQFGGEREPLVAAARHRERRLRWYDMLDGIGADCRAAWRSTCRSPRTSVMVMLLLALGAGANGALSGLVYRIVVRGPAGVMAPAELVRLFQTEHSGLVGDHTSDHMPSGMYDALRTRLHVGSSIAMYYGNPVTLGTPDDPRRGNATYVTESYFRVLGAQPALGRTFLPDEDRDGGPAVAILGWNFWQREFGGDVKIIGRRVPIGRRSFQIVGVMPRGFNGTGFQVMDIWLPFGTPQPATNPHSWNSSGPQIILRRLPGTSVDAISTQVAEIYRTAYLGYPESRASRTFAAPISASAQGTQLVETAMLRWMVLVAAIILLIACANAANLLLARAANRQGEMAVRVALGAGRWRVTRLVVVEGGLIAAFAAVAAFVLAEAGAVALRRLYPDVDPAIDGTAIATFCVTGIVALAGGLAASAGAVMQSLRPDIASDLKTSQRSIAARQSRIVPVLTLVQVALSTVLVIGAGLFVRSAREIAAIDVGIDPTHLLQFGIDLPAPTDGTPDSVITRTAMAAYDALIDRVTAVPGITVAAIAVGTPLGNVMSRTLRVAGMDSIPKTAGGGPNESEVTADYFAAVGTRIVAGRGFDAGDRGGSSRVAIIDREMARVIWPRENPVGKCLVIGASQCTRIVGIAANAIQHDVGEQPAMHYYLPISQATVSSGAELLVRTSLRRPLTVMPAVRRAIRSVIAGARFSSYDGMQMQDDLDRQTLPWRMAAAIFTVLGVLALLVATIGLYSVISWQVVKRTRELGIRLALGAARMQVIRLVTERIAIIVVSGMVIGAGAAWLLAARLSEVLFRTSPHDAAGFLVPLMVLCAAAGVAALVPAWRATCVDVMDAVRAE